MTKINANNSIIESGEVGDGLKCYIACGLACFLISGGLAAFIAGIGSAL